MFLNFARQTIIAEAVAGRWTDAIESRNIAKQAP